MKRVFLTIAIISVLFIIECKKDTAYTPDCSGAVKSYKTDVKPLISSYCAQCHNFSTYSQLSANAANIRSRIVDGSMPKNATLSSDQKNKIVCWIDSGFPNN